MNPELELRKQESSPMLITLLQREASNNPVFRSIAEMFALRERTRQQITVHSLSATMKKEGYDYTKSQLREVLRFLASLRLGRLELSPKGTIVALKGITYTLQSIGMASVSNKASLSKHNIPIPFKRLPVPSGDSLPTNIGNNEGPIEKQVIIDSVLKKPIKEDSLSIKIGHKTFTFDLFPENKVQSLLEIVDKIYSEKNKKGG